MSEDIRGSIIYVHSQLIKFCCIVVQSSEGTGETYCVHF